MHLISIIRKQDLAEIIHLVAFNARNQRRDASLLCDFLQMHLSALGFTFLASGLAKAAIYLPKTRHESHSDGTFEYTLPDPLPLDDVKPWLDLPDPEKKLIDFRLGRNTFSIGRDHGRHHAHLVRLVSYHALIHRRPGIISFLKRCKQNFNLAVFTASEQEYADGVIAIVERYANETLFPANARLYRPDTVRKNGLATKPLRMLGFDMRRVLLIDNSAGVFVNDLVLVRNQAAGLKANLPSNGLIVMDFRAQDLNDGAILAKHRHELDQLERLLGKLASPSVKDVRPFVIEAWNWNHYKYRTKMRLP
jgi:hypothetical protein